MPQSSRIERRRAFIPVHSPALYNELRATFRGDDEEFESFLDAVQNVLMRYWLRDRASSAEFADKMVQIANLARDLQRALYKEPFFSELLRIEGHPDTPQEDEKLKSRCKTLFSELGLMERRSRSAAHNGRKRAPERKTRKGEYRAALWEPIIAVWAQHEQESGYGQSGVYRVISAVHDALKLDPPNLNSVRAVIRASKKSSP